MSREAGQSSPSRALRVDIATRPASVSVFEGRRADLIAHRRRKALEREFARGERAASSAAAAMLTRAVEVLALTSATQCAELARDATRLAVEIARVLLRHEIDAGRYDLERIVRETLQASGIGRGACVLHLNPADAARLKDVVLRAGTTIESDPEVPAGDVHVTTQRGLLVRDVEQALASIAERLEGDVT